MKIMGTGDNHMHKDSRFAECCRVHDWIAEQVELQQPDLFVDGGDIYDAASTPEERGVVAAWVQRIANVCPFVLTKGNHDRKLECALLAKLSARHPIIVEEAAAVHYVRGVAIACVAWPERAGILALAAQHGADANAIEREALQAVLRGLGEELAAHDGPKLALGHFMVDGSASSTGQPLIGMSMNVSLAELSLLNAPIVLMSHIHLGQEWSFGDMVAHYMGSPHRNDYGEMEKKSISVVTYDGSRFVGVERIETPCTPMVHFELEYSAANGDLIDTAHPPTLARVNVAGADIRLRYSVAPEHREAARAKAHELRDLLLTGMPGVGPAAAVKIDEVVETTTRARAPEMVAATSDADRLEAYWKAKNDVPEGPRKRRLLEKFALLQGGAS